MALTWLHVACLARLCLPEIVTRVPDFAWAPVTLSFARLTATVFGGCLATALQLVKIHSLEEKYILLAPPLRKDLEALASTRVC